jgi:cell division protein FtsL
MDAATVGRAAVVFVVLLGALGLVTWRQSRTLESLASLDDLHRRISVAVAERVELERDVLALESRARVVPEARERLGMHVPEGDELVQLRGGSRP